MLKMLILAALLLCSAALILLFQQWQQRQSRAVRKYSNTSIRPFTAVGIRTNKHACSAVRPYYGKRFLSDDAPAMPVIGCTVRPCPCRYIHYTDRRTEDRRAMFGISDRLYDTTNTDRRRSDRRQMIAST